MSDSIIQINNMNKWFGDFQVLKGINLEVKPKQKIVVCGPSGSGKSTLIRHLNRLIDPTDGDILVDGTNIMDLDEQQLIDFRKHELSMVFQRFGLFPHKTVIENIGYGLEIQGKEVEERKKLAMIQIELLKYHTNFCSNLFYVFCIFC